MTTIDTIAYYLYKLDRDDEKGYRIDYLCERLQSYPIGWVDTVQKILTLRGQWPRPPGCNKAPCGIYL